MKSKYSLRIGLIRMNNNEGRESYYRIHDSQISQPWMDQENSTALHTRPNLSDVECTSNPNLDVIASSPDLQWFLQSSLFSQPETTLGPFSSFVPSTMPSCPCLSQLSSPDPSCNGAERDNAAGHDKHMSSEDHDKIRIRRERNRIAAARCRDRRRMLIDTLQNETDHLEQVKTRLEEEIAGLERERDRLELIFEAHMPICKVHDPNPTPNKR